MLDANSIRPRRLAAGILIACLAAIGASEVTGISRIERTLIHRDFQAYQFAFFCLLWASSMILVRWRLSKNKPSLLAFLLLGLCAGLISSWLTFPVVGVLTGQSWSSNARSWEGIAGFLAVTSVTTFGWLIGVISGAISFSILRLHVLMTHADP